MTEEEAKTQDCIGPEGCGESVLDAKVGQAWSLTQGRPVRRLCKGAACKMAWRWIDPGYDTEYSTGHTGEQPPDGEGWALRYWDGRVRWARKRPNVDGYCGLAGRPEGDSQ